MTNDSLTKGTIMTTPRKHPTLILLALCLLSTLPGCATTSKDKPALITTGLVNIGPARDYPAGTVSTKFLERYGIAIANDSGPVLAILPHGPKPDIRITWQAAKNQFISSDGSAYDILGRVLKGPATQPLKGIEATGNPDGTLAVDLDKLYRP